MPANIRLFIVFVLVIAIAGALLVFDNSTKNTLPHGLVSQFFPAQAPQSAPEQTAPLIILLGGSEGGIWEPDSYEVYDLLTHGYNVATIGYFAMPGIPRHLSQINLDQFGKTFNDLKTLPGVNSDCIGIIGVSKGAELALNLGARYPQIHMVAAITPAHVSFQASNISLSQRSSWMFEGAEVPFVPFPMLSKETLDGVLSGENYTPMHMLALQNTEAEDAARIRVEDINGPILLISGKSDQMWPSSYMAKQVMDRLNAHNFSFPHKHLDLEVDHNILGHPAAWKTTMRFIRQNLTNTAACQVRPTVDQTQ